MTPDWLGTPGRRLYLAPQMMLLSAAATRGLLVALRLQGARGVTA